MSNRDTDRFRTLGDFVKASGLKKYRIAADLGVSARQFSELLYPEVYRPKVNDVLVEKIAHLLNQSPDYVRRLYERAA